MKSITGLLISCFLLISTAEIAAGAQASLSASQATVIWKQALQAGINNETGKAIRLLQQLLDKKQSEVGEDLILITAGRLFYQQEAFDKAVEYYKKVPRTSDYWLEAIEERAWAYAKQKKYDEAKSDLQTLTAPLFAPHLGPEAYLLQGFVDLKTCDYKGVFDTLKLFKERYQKRSDGLKALVENPRSVEVQGFFDKLKVEKLSQTKLGADAQRFPRLSQRDENLKRAVKTGNKTEAFEKISALAQDDLDEVYKVLKRMHIIEIEAIQRMHGQKPIAKGELKNHEAGPNQVKFPYSGEVWLDELDHYKVSSDACPSAKGT
jgi:tetratricopeptide (TPR) repeat protein